GQNSIAHSGAAGGVRQQPIAAPEQVYQALGVTLEADAPDRDRDDLGPARLEAIEQYLLVWITGSADEKPRGERSAGDYQRVGHRAKSSKVCLSRPKTGAQSRHYRRATGAGKAIPTGVQQCRSRQRRETELLDLHRARR